MQTLFKKLLLLGAFFSLSFQSVWALSAPTFHDVSSTVMMDTLKTYPKNHYLNTLYSQLFYIPIWIQEEKLSRFSEALLTAIEKDFTLEEMSELKIRSKALREKAEAMYQDYTPMKEKMAVEFEMAALYKNYMEYTLYGSINWGAFQARMYNLRAEGIKAEWVTYKPTFTPISVLLEAVNRGNLATMLKEVEPKAYHYPALKKALEKYLKIEKEGGWKHLALGGKIRLGQSYSMVPELRKHLTQTGDAKGCKQKGSVYTRCLKTAVIHFQKRHGLVAKGVLGMQTADALNVPLLERIQTLKLNLDRIKWLHVRKDKWHIVINIPAFTLFFEEGGVLRQEMRVITGKRKNPTPIFSNRVKTIVLNPHWNLPKSIIQKEMIPKLMQNPKAMDRKGIEIYNGWGPDAEKVSGDSVNWEQYLYSKNLPFRFAQLPGNKNALGKVKFLFPNQFAVYMHDTPTKHLFNNNVRALSHGCIRLHKPRELLRTFSTFNENVDFETAQETLSGTDKSYLKLNSEVPIDVVYLTAYVDYDGVLQFRKDIYGYDEMQLQAYRTW